MTEVSSEGIEWYANMKEHVISKYSTPKVWVNSLLGECNKKFKINMSFDSYKDNKTVLIPDLGVYRFVVEECVRRRDIYNVFTIL